MIEINQLNLNFSNLPGRKHDVILAQTAQILSTYQVGFDRYCGVLDIKNICVGERDDETKIAQAIARGLADALHLKKGPVGD